MVFKKKNLNLYLEIVHNLQRAYYNMSNQATSTSFNTICIILTSMFDANMSLHHKDNVNIHTLLHVGETGACWRMGQVDIFLFVGKIMH